MAGPSHPFFPSDPPAGDTPGPDPGTPGYLTRRPLLDGEYRVVGYELAIRDRAPLPVPPGAVSWRAIQDELLLAGVVDMQFQTALGRKLILLDLDWETLGHPWLGKLPRDGLILASSLPAAPRTDPLSRLQALGRAGFVLALDLPRSSPTLAPLVRQCRYLRLDVGDRDLTGLKALVHQARLLGAPRLIAREVDTEETYLACRKLDVDLHQGRFFTQAGTHPTRTLDASRARVVRLLNLVMGRAEYTAIEAEIKLDPAIAHRLLRFVNSPAVGLRYPVRAIHHMLLLLGHDTLYRWLTLLMFARQGSGHRDRTLLKQALVRARLMELLAVHCVPDGQRDGAFVAGILSMLEPLLGIPMAEAIADLRLDPEMSDLLLHGRGPLAPCLALARDCEGEPPNRGESEEGEGSTDKAPPALAPETVNRAHLEALAWAEGMDL